MRRLPPTSWPLAVAAITVMLTACRGNAGLVPPSNGSTAPGIRAHAVSFALEGKPTGKIQHIVVIVQENRSLNNLFYGFPGAKTQSYGNISSGQKVALKPVSLATTWDLQHNGVGFIRSCDGTGKIPGTDCKMDGFNLQQWSCGGGSGEPKCPDKYPPYSYVPHDEVKPYFDMANQYVLGDEMFASDFDTSSFISHQYIIAGVNPESSAEYPETTWGCPGGKADKIDALGKDRSFLVNKLVPCWNPTTLADELDAKSISWSFYASPVSGSGGKPCGTSAGPDVSKGRAGIWSAYQAISHICYGPDWSADVVSPSSKFLSDITSNLRSVTWITPTYANSDHGGSGSKTGPSWVASLVNAIGESPYWSSTAIFIFWDDSGGWYDPEAPQYLDNDGLGFRLPLLIISPYAKQGYVSHVHYEHGSILKFIEDQFGLARLAASDARAKSPEADSFDFKKPPRAFTPIKAPYDRSFFLNQPLDLRPPDAD